jgi:hypothetical protein
MNMTTKIMLLFQKTPFAGGGTNANSDLGAFYRECQAAPPLKTFAEQPSLAEQVSALPSQLEHFEQSQAEFDAILASLLQSQAQLTWTSAGKTQTLKFCSLGYKRRARLIISSFPFNFYQDNQESQVMLYILICKYSMLWRARVKSYPFPMLLM